MGWLFATDNSGALLIARLTLGLVLFPHGAAKALGWFGGAGIEETVDSMLELGISAPLTYLVILVEFGGSIALILGLFGRLAAAGVVTVMAVAVMVHLPHGFFMDWEGMQAGEGYEYHLLAIGLAATVLLGGSGALSLDSLIAAPPRRRRRAPAPPRRR